ncbi:MAG: PPA1309 family protein [Nocardioides sp.]|uniref:PPA1309 family protein n=1 Tax=Nocardioides sp. TaxID=35761 RepID=UPI0039E3EF74
MSDLTDMSGSFETDPALAAAVLELEAHAAQGGWDRPATLYALVDTAEFIASEPTLADLLGLADDASAEGSLTPIEQDQIARPLEEVLSTIAFPPSVSGVAVVVERPDGELGQAGRETEHLRVVAGVTRAGAAYCAMRSRTHDSPESVVAGGEDLVPQLVELLRAVLEDGGEDSSEEDAG